MEQELNAPVYFAETHKPWQRGTNENTNGILRFYFPKGYDFRNVTQDELDAVVRQINARPRKCLGWRTPQEGFPLPVLLFIDYLPSSVRGERSVRCAITPTLQVRESTAPPNPAAD